jgi:hypothetical protein
VDLVQEGKEVQEVYEGHLIHEFVNVIIFSEPIRSISQQTSIARNFHRSIIVFPISSLLMDETKIFLTSLPFIRRSQRQRKLLQPIWRLLDALLNPDTWC